MSILNIFFVHLINLVLIIFNIKFYLIHKRYIFKFRFPQFEASKWVKIVYKKLENKEGIKCLRHYGNIMIVICVVW